MKQYFLLEEVSNFQGFWVFDFGPYTEIKNSENSEIFSRFVNFKECSFFEELGNFQGFRIFDFGPYNYWNWKFGTLGNIFKTC